MRKQVQKERCTKIMLTKCKAVCHLYDKVQLAAAKMLDAQRHYLRQAHQYHGAGEPYCLQNKTGLQQF